MTPIIILGAAGTAVDVLDFLADINERTPTYQCLGLLDDNEALHGTTIHGTPVLGPLAMAQAYPTALVVNALGSPGSFHRRHAILAALALPRERFTTIIHPTAVVSRWATIGTGAIIYPYSVILPDVEVGDHVTLLSQCTLNHETVVGNYTIFATGVTVCGRVHIGSHCYLGAGCTIIHEVSIGDRSLIGMGSVVVRDVAPNSVMVGNPARFLRQTVERSE